MSEAQLLLVTAASIAFVHTLLGPDHYLPFMVMGKARRWSFLKTMRMTLLCGAGHVMSSVLIGIVGLLIGARLSALVEIEGMRGNLAGWALLAFGLMYFAWGLKKAGRSHTHAHLHAHGDVVHSHSHDHQHEHAHAHTKSGRATVTPWAMFIVFVLGPCEALIPLFMYPAAQQSYALVLSVALTFGLVTLATMMAAVALGTLGIRNFSFRGGARYAHALAGASVAVCGAAISFMGL
ncbi:MAG: sulfite exporter TauE/SafE family protein [Gammaproteobacteria bacterium]|nr:sulfite exporter TauE/SafE family protein [Gammaproteobacteria bacterium]